MLVDSKVIFKSRFGRIETGVVQSDDSIRVRCNCASYSGYMYYTLQDVEILKENV
jgi:hypothetical protein